MLLCARVRLRIAPLVSFACSSTPLRRPLVSHLSSLALPPNSSTPTVQQHVDAFEKALNTRIPPRHFVDYPAAFEQLEGTVAHRSTSRSTGCSIRSAQIDGCEGAIPLTFETIDESTASYVNAVSRQVDQYFRAKREQPSDTLRLPAELYNADEPSPEPSTFATEEDLDYELFADLRPVLQVYRLVRSPRSSDLSLDRLPKVSTRLSAVFQSHAPTQQSLLAGNGADQSDRSGKKCEKAVPQQRRAERSKKGGAAGIKLGGVSGQTRYFSAHAGDSYKSHSGCIKKEHALPLRFDLVAAWWGEGQGRSKPTRFELATARDSQPANDHVPTIVQDKLLSKVDSLSVSKSTALNLVFKKVWVADERAPELLDERAAFEELYRHEDAPDYLVGYVGFFESTIESHYLLVTEAGEEVEDWTEESAAVIHLVEQLHRHGYVHGDLAERNIVRTPAGLRLIDLGRARRAEEHELAQEMEQLKKVLAGEADWLDYSFLGYYFW